MYPVEPRLDLAGPDFALTLRFAAQANPEDASVMMDLYRGAGFYSIKELHLLADFLKFKGFFVHVYHLLKDERTEKILANCSPEARQALLNLFNDSSLPPSDYSSGIIEAVQELSKNVGQVEEERFATLFTQVKDNEFDHLRALLEEARPLGLGSVTLQPEEDEVVLEL